MNHTTLRQMVLDEIDQVKFYATNKPYLYIHKSGMIRLNFVSYSTKNDIMERLAGPPVEGDFADVERHYHGFFGDGYVKAFWNSIVTSVSFEKSKQTFKMNHAKELRVVLNAISPENRLSELNVKICLGELKLFYNKTGVEIARVEVDNGLFTLITHECEEFTHSITDPLPCIFYSPTDVDFTY